MRSLVLGMAWISLTACRALGFTGNTAGSTAHFLRIGPSARALGMGEAYGPIAEGAEALYWNPAGLAALERPEVSYSHAEMLRFFRHEYVSYAHPVRLLGGTVAGSATLFHQDDLDLVTNTNLVVGKFTSRSEAYTLAYARAFSVGEDFPARDREFFQDYWSLPGAYRPLDHGNELWTGSLLAGVAVKYVVETIHTNSASALAFDGGVLFRHQELPGLRLSFAFRNAGTAERFIREEQDLPAELGFGVAYDFAGERHRFLPALEASLPYYGPPYGKLGGEYSMRIGDWSWVSFRLGYKSLAAQELAPLAGVTGGVGVRYERVNVDFGFEPMAELGNVLRASVGFRF